LLIISTIQKTKEPKSSTPNDYIDIDPDKNTVSLLDTSILIDVMNWKIDLNKPSLNELRNRGLDLKGNWFGFDNKD